MRRARHPPSHLSGFGPTVPRSVTKLFTPGCGHGNRPVPNSNNVNVPAADMEETWTARFFRDNRLLSIGGGADEVMLRVLSSMDGFTGGGRTG